MLKSYKHRQLNKFINNALVSYTSCYHFGFLTHKIMIQPTDLKRFRELLSMTFRKNGNEFETNEIRIEKDMISIWDCNKKDWYYLNKNLDWVSDLEDEDILKLSE